MEPGDSGVTGPKTSSEAELVESRSFDYRSVRFTLRVQLVDRDLFVPQVLYEGGVAGIAPMVLPVDCEPYGTDAEAWRHAEQQAVRWANDRTGDGQAQF
jgi:hypothetical protein